MEKQFNVFEEEIEECCSNPITGFFRDGFCHTDNLDQGLHVVCAHITEDFLEFSKSRGNDLSTPKEEFNFPGLKKAITGAFVQRDGKKLMRITKRQRFI